MTADKYFKETVEYPGSRLILGLQMGIDYQYVPSSYLNGVVNYVKPVKAWLLGRYKHAGCGAGTEDDDCWTDEHYREAIQRLGEGYHASDLHSKLQDDVYIVGRVDPALQLPRVCDYDEVHICRPSCKVDNTVRKTLWAYLWFDCDVSDCSIGLFQTNDSAKKVLAAFEQALDDNRYSAKRFEIPTQSLRGWISF